jgi:hypothetical protein
MRGHASSQPSFFAYVNIESRIPASSVASDQAANGESFDGAGRAVCGAVNIRLFPQTVKEFQSSYCLAKSKADMPEGVLPGQDATLHGLWEALKRGKVWSPDGIISWKLHDGPESARSR